jgi:hypothetical protein
MIAKSSSWNTRFWTSALAVLLGAGVAVLQAQEADVTQQEISKAGSAFANFRNLVNAADLKHEREGGAASLFSLRSLGINPENLEVFTARARPLVAEEAAFKRRSAAAMCARKNELFTLALYVDALKAENAEIGAWRAQRLREFMGSLPADEKAPPADNARALSTGGGMNPADVVDLNIIPSNLLMKMEVVAYPNEQSFQQWRQTPCPTATG